MQHRAALRAKARRSNAERRKLLWPTIVIIAVAADIQRRARHARLMEAARLMGQHLRSRLFAPSFAEQIFPVVDDDVADALAFGVVTPGMIERTMQQLGPLKIGGDEPLSYEIGWDGVVTFYADAVPVMHMDIETFNQIRNEPEAP